MASGDHTWPGLTPVLGSAKDHTHRGFVKTSHNPRPVPRDVHRLFLCCGLLRGGRQQAAEAGCTWLPGAIPAVTGMPLGCDSCLAPRRSSAPLSFEGQ